MAKQSHDLGRLKRLHAERQNNVLMPSTDELAERLVRQGLASKNILDRPSRRTYRRNR